MQHGNEGDNVNGRHASLDEEAREPHIAEVHVHREQPHSNSAWMITCADPPPADDRADNGTGPEGPQLTRRPVPLRFVERGSSFQLRFPEILH